MSWEKTLDGEAIISFVDCDKYLAVRQRKGTPWIELDSSEHAQGSSEVFSIHVKHRLDSATARQLADRILKWCDEIDGTNREQNEGEETELERLRRLYTSSRYLQSVYVKTIVGSYFESEAEFDKWFDAATESEMKGTKS